MRNHPATPFVLCLTILLLACACAEAIPAKKRMEKPAVERPQVVSGQTEKAQFEKSPVPRPAPKKYPANSLPREISKVERPQIKKSQFENPAFQDSFRNPNKDSQAVFPHKNLHRPLRMRGHHSTDNYIKGSTIKSHQPRIRGHFLYHNTRSDRELAP